MYLDGCGVQMIAKYPKQGRHKNIKEDTWNKSTNLTYNELQLHWHFWFFKRLIEKTYLSKENQKGIKAKRICTLLT